MSRPNIDMTVRGASANKSCTYETKILKGNIPFAEQIGDINTKYVIKWDFDLDGNSVTIPEGCLIEMDGGTISNGTMVGDHTILIYFQDFEDCIKSVTMQGTWKYNNPRDGIMTENIYDENLDETQKQFNARVNIALEEANRRAQAIIPLPDEEDLTTNGDHNIKLKNKAYAPAQFSGLGKTYLRKNIVEIALPFDGFVDDVTLESEGLTSAPVAIFFDSTNGIFVGIDNLLNPKYYGTWLGGSAYNTEGTLADDNEFKNTSDDTYYKYNDGALVSISTPTTKNILTQEMLSQANTVYNIQYDYELGEVDEKTLTFTSANVSSVMTPEKIELDAATAAYAEDPSAANLARKNMAQAAFEAIGSQDYYYWLSVPMQAHHALHLTGRAIRLNDAKSEQIATDKGIVYAEFDMTVYVGCLAGSYSYRYDNYLYIPNNCILQFEGGSLSNGTVVGNNTKIQGSAEDLLNYDIIIGGTWDVDGIIIPKGKDITSIVQKMLDLFGYVKFGAGTYYVSDSVTIRKSQSKILGSGFKATIIKPIKNNVSTVFKTLLPGEEGTSSSDDYEVEMTVIRGITFTSNNALRLSNVLLVKGPSSTLENLRISNVDGYGITIGCWCNRIINCIIDHYEEEGIKTIGSALNNLVISECRIETGKYGIKLKSGYNIIIKNNTLEENSIADIYLYAIVNILIDGNYFEGHPVIPKENIYIQYNSTAAGLSDDISTHIVLSGSQVDDSIISVGNTYCPASVVIVNNFVEGTSTDYNTYLCAIGSCKGSLVIENNVLRLANTVAAFFNFGDSLFNNVKIVNNIRIKDNVITPPLDLITKQNFAMHSLSGKSHFDGTLELDNPSNINYTLGDNINYFGVIRDQFRDKATYSLYSLDSDAIIKLDFTDETKRRRFGTVQRTFIPGVYKFEFDIKMLSGTDNDNNVLNIVYNVYGPSEAEIKEMTCKPSSEWSHIQFYIPVSNLINLPFNVAIYADAGKGTNVYLVRNPIIYKVGRIKPAFSYFIKESNYTDQAYAADVHFNTRNSPIGTRGFNKDNVPCLVTGQDSNGYDTWATIQSLLNIQ